MFLTRIIDLTWLELVWKWKSIPKTTFPLGLEIALAKRLNKGNSDRPRPGPQPLWKQDTRHTSFFLNFPNHINKIHAVFYELRLTVLKLNPDSVDVQLVNCNSSHMIRIWVELDSRSEEIPGTETMIMTMIWCDQAYFYLIQSPISNPFIHFPTTSSPDGDVSGLIWLKQFIFFHNNICAGCSIYSGVGRTV